MLLAQSLAFTDPSPLPEGFAGGRVLTYSGKVSNPYFNYVTAGANITDIRATIIGDQVLHQPQALSISDNNPPPPASNQGTSIYRVIDDSENNFQADPGFISTAAGGYLGTRSYSNTGTWNFGVVPSGNYRVFATWTPGGANGLQARTRYGVTGNDAVLTETTFDTIYLPEGFSWSSVNWQAIGDISIPDGGQNISVQMSSLVNGAGLVADAIRIDTLDTLAAPPTPISFYAPTQTASSITLNWVSGNGTTSGFYLAYNEGTLAPLCNTGAFISANVLKQTISNLKAGTKYAFSICSVDDSKRLSPQLTTTAMTVPAPPTAPSNLALSADNANCKINANWTASKGEIYYYRVGFIPGGYVPKDCASIKGDGPGVPQSSYFVGCTASNYVVYVCAVDRFGQYSPIVSAPVSVTQPSPPAAPTGLTLAAPNPFELIANWQPGNSSIAKYAVGYKAGKSATCDYYSADATPSVDLTNLTANTLYAVAVCAVDKWNQMSSPNLQTFTLPAAPPPVATPTPTAKPTPTPTPTPVVTTASLTVNGSTGTVSVKANSSVTYAWSSKNASTGSSTYYVSAGPNLCHHATKATAWVANSINGSSTSTVPLCEKGSTYVYTYTAKGAGAAVTTTVTVKVQ